MNTSSISELRPQTQPDHAQEHALDRTLTEIRSGRRLEKIAASIQSFLDSQFSRLESALVEVQSAEENDKILQRILADFEKEKQAWEEQRQAEILRLQNASEQLISGWQQLEDERRKWMGERDDPSNGTHGK